MRFWVLTVQRGWVRLTLVRFGALVEGSAAPARGNAAGHIDDAGEHSNEFLRCMGFRLNHPPLGGVMGFNLNGT